MIYGNFRVTGAHDTVLDYHAARNQFERFRGFWNQLADSKSNFVVAEIIFYNSILNVVVSVTTCVYIYKYFEIYSFVNVYQYVFVNVYAYVFLMYKYMYIFRDLQSVLSKTKSVWT